MTRILFVQDVLFDYHSIEALSSALKKANHQVGLFILDAEKQNIGKYIKKTNPDIVAFSISSSDYRWAIPVAKITKKLGKIALFGGPHPTYFPEFIDEPYVDIICIGEGEQAIVELANAIGTNKPYTKIKNLYVKLNGKVYKNPIRPLEENLNNLPNPDKVIYYKYKFLKNTPVKRILTSRGCPYNCTYCYNQKYKELYNKKGTYLRYRSKERVIEEILDIKKKAILKSITFTADSFTSNKKWLLEFLKDYKKKVNLPFYCQLRANELSEEVVVALKNANCKYVYFGIETGNEYIRNIIYKKGITNNQIIDAARLLHKYKIKFLTYNIFGAPHETLDNAWETIYLNNKIRPDAISATILQPQVGTEVYKRICEENLFIPNHEEIMFGHYAPSPIKLKNKRKIENLHKFSYYAAIYPFTIPFIRLLINLPPNPVFNLIFKSGLFLRYKKSRNYSLIDIIKVGWNLRKFS